MEINNITRNDVVSAARAWAEADHEEGFTRGDPESTMRQIQQKSITVDEARENFEKILDAWREQQVERAINNASNPCYKPGQRVLV